MAQRKTPNVAAKKKPGARPAATNRPNARPATGSGAKSAAGGRPPARKPGKSIVNQKQTPWCLIATIVVLVLFAVGIVAHAVTRSSSSPTSAADKSYVQPQIAAAKAITGLVYKKEPKHTHVTGVVKYDTSPPIGGDHSQIWADCQGTVYNHQIANENAVHMLEHGTVWITYNPKTATAADIKTLSGLVDGVDRMALTPYAGLKTPISLQAWDYQLFVTKATDPRVKAFVDALRNNPKTTPENASCQPPSGAWDASKSTPGHPID